jgi:predicted TIM-barrel fold metal-dependent hydrolase
MQSDINCSIFGDAKRVIDVHHHFEPSAKNVNGVPWTIEMALDQMDRNGVTTAIGYAGPLFPSDVRSGRKIARETNEWSAQLCRTHPGRFGLFASLPLADVEGSLAEIAYAFDVLHADGVGLATHYDGMGLGDPAFEPIFAELNRRNAVVYVHPANAPCATASTLTYESDLISAPWIEFPTNTARTILSLWTAGLTRRLPDLRFIFCHGGGVLPILLGRFASTPNSPSSTSSARKPMRPKRSRCCARFCRLRICCSGPTSATSRSRIASSYSANSICRRTCAR